MSNTDIAKDRMARAMYEAGKQELGGGAVARAGYASKVDKIVCEAYDRGIAKSLEKVKREKHGLNLRPFLSQ